LDGKYSDVETTELMDLASFLDPRFITNYIDLSNVKERLISKSSEIQENSNDTMESTESVESTENNEAENNDTGGFLLNKESCQVGLKSVRQTSSTGTVSLKEKIKRDQCI